MNDIDKIFGDDYEVPGQMEITDLEGFEAPYQAPMVATSKVFASAIKQMHLREWKTFIYALTHIRWMEPNGNRVKMNKWKLAELLESNADSSDINAVLRKSLGDIPKHSFLEFESKDKKEWDNGCFISRIGVRGDYVYLTFTQEYLPLFSELQREGRYITMWAEDLFKMRSERSILFYESLRLHSDTRTTNSRIYGIRDLKEMFGIPKEGKGSYMRKDNHFDRPAFERYVLTPLCEDLQKCRMIQLNILEDGKPWRKIKYHGRVRGYEFSWAVTDRPAIVTAQEHEEIKADPELLKIAKDIKDGEKKSKKNSFRNFEEQEYDMDAIAKIVADRG